MSDYIPPISAGLAILVIAIIIGRFIISGPLANQTIENCDVSSKNFASTMGAAMERWCEKNE